ncbi:MAG TPA: hypothetical protein VFB51_05650 [Solirubrobacterales bacterium]|nr:hypothetical protein [Solirubrobacterales bacterium]
MTRLLAGELIKVRTTRTAVSFAAAGLLLAVATIVIVALVDDPGTVRDKRNALAFGGWIAALMLIYGAVGATGEFRHRTLAPAVLIAPDRYRLVMARMLAYGLTAGLGAIAIGAVTYAVGIPLLAGTPGPSLDGRDYLGVAVGGILASMMCAAIGVAVGTLIRNQVAAQVGLLLWIFVVESLVTLPEEDLVDYTLGTSFGVLSQGGNVDGTMLHAGLVLTAWLAVLATAATLIDRRRDVE